MKRQLFVTLIFAAVVMILIGITSGCVVGPPGHHASVNYGHPGAVTIPICPKQCVQPNYSIVTPTPPN